MVIVPWFTHSYPLGYCLVLQGLVFLGFGGWFFLCRPPELQAMYLQ